MSFAGRSAVVTGAASGIGKALALEFARHQMIVHAVDLGEEGLHDLEAEGKKFGGEILGVLGDVTSEEDLTRVRAKALEKSRHLDLWVNNAGVAGLGDFLELDGSAFRRVIEVNLMGLVNGTRVALQAMERSGHGTIVNMASMAGHLPAPFMSAYNASKHGVVGFTRSLREELRLKNSPVRMVLVSPGFCNTRILNKGGEHLGFPKWLSFLLSTPEKVAEEILEGLKKGRDEIYPTLNGRIMRRMYSLMPTRTVRSSKILLAQSFKDVLLNRYTLDR